ncbi:aminotransferase class III-fold pyridoxal phosphate-dependent enzyme [Pseudomonas sp. NPDC090202]|uniref:aminotransferase class III-fold pyridoxal phosphate-dependent enzyme n=1 Tax=unclassified Pseudomonas TaxID=196821 RepID=UPI00382D286C
MNLLKLLRSATDDAPVADHGTLLSPLQRLCERTGSDQGGFFVDEHGAFTGAMSLARQWGQVHRHGACGVVVASGGRFDGLLESMATDFCRVPFNDLAALEAAVDSRTVLVVLEPIQRGAVVSPASQAYMLGVEKLCRALNILLVLNEARGAFSQNGRLLCEDSYGVNADIVVLGDHSNRSPRSSALLARGQACISPIEDLPGCVQLPASPQPARASGISRPQRELAPRGLMA